MDTISSITFSAAAIDEIKRLRAQQSQPSNAYIKLSLLRGGCMEWYYNLSFTLEQNDLPSYRVSTDTDHCLQVVIPDEEHALLNGLHIDYSEDLMGGGFRFSNPQATQTCGCGHSFSTQDSPTKENPSLSSEGFSDSP
jgi:iron-sulfur cluster assembly accessory protein